MCLFPSESVIAKRREHSQVVLGLQNQLCVSTTTFVPVSLVLPPYMRLCISVESGQFRHGGAVRPFEIFHFPSEPAGLGSCRTVMI